MGEKGLKGLEADVPGRHPVQCAVGSSNFQYAFVGSNPYYIKLQITNTRCAPTAPSGSARRGCMLHCLLQTAMRAPACLS